MPAVVIVIQERPLRLLCRYVFTVARWSVDVASTPLDALAFAFNAEADLIVTSRDDAGLELTDLLSRDEVLRDTPCVMLVPAGSDGPRPNLPSFETLSFPCDLYWMVVAADTHLGRETPRGLGRRAASEDDLDTTIHRWWWALAAADLMRYATGCAANAGSPEVFAAEMAHRLGCRVGADITSADADDAWRIQIGDDLTWSIRPDDDEPISDAARACVTSVASIVGNLMPFFD